MLKRTELIKRIIALLVVSCVFLGNVPAAGIYSFAVDNGIRDSEKKGIIIDPTDMDGGWMSVLYDNENGLPTTEANTIAETSEGFIWIGSYGGLIRYDGNTFERMDSTGGITSVLSLYVDKKDRLWIGTNANGIAVMENGEYRIWDKDDGLRSVSIHSLCEDGNGNIYFGSTEGLGRINTDMELEMLEDPRISEAYVSKLCLGKDGLIYGVTLEGDLFTLGDGKITSYTDHGSSAVNGVMYILPDPSRPGYVYYGTEDSFVYYGKMDTKRDELKIYDVAPLSCIESMNCIDGKIWICSKNGVGMLDDGGFHLLDNVPMNNNVERVMADYEGNLWFTSARQGVMKIVPNRFIDIFDRYDLPPSVVNTTCICGDELFIGTDDGLIVLSNGEKAEHIPVTGLPSDDLLEYLDGIRIRSIIRDSKDRLWIATWRKYGLICYDKGQVTVFDTGNGLFSDRVRVAFERSDGAVMVANTGGISVIKDGRVSESYSESSGIVNTEILTVEEGTNGDMILGSDGGGIYILGSSGTRHIGVEEGLGSEVVMRIKHDERNKVYWIVTTNSIAFMDENYNVTTVSKFPYPNNFDIYVNSSNEAWIMAGNGIYVMRVEELLANKDISPVYYNRDNGLKSIATANSYSALTDDGFLYIAGTNGVSKVNIDQTYENVHDLKAAVPYIEADGETIYPDADGIFTIPSDKQKISIPCFIFNYSLVNPRVSYKLEGFDKQSSSLLRSEIVPVDYTNLSGNTYTFVLDIEDNMGHDSKSMSFTIVKEKKLYERAWFNILLIALLAFMLEETIRLFVRSKTRKLQKKNLEAYEQFEQTAEALASAIDAKDSYTNGHSRRVAEYSLKIAREAGLNKSECDKVYFAALLHDVGKIGVPIEILTKKSRLTDEEFDQIKQHPVVGGQILARIHNSPWLSIGARYHHERFNGKGYPEGLRGKDIPEIARIIAVADAYDAMTSNRSYRNAIPQHIVREELVKGIGTQFDPEYAKIMIHLLDLDTEYLMQEREEGANLTPTTSLRCDTIYSDCTEGVSITDRPTRIRLCSWSDDGVSESSSLPSLIVFDSLDAKVHPGEEDNKDLLYLEYAQVRLDGNVVPKNIRNFSISEREPDRNVMSSDTSEPENGRHYLIEAVRIKDHARIRISGEYEAKEIIIALPDSSRFMYLALGGENCYIHNIIISTENTVCEPDSIPRIAEEINYIKDCPEGDVPNIEICGWRAATTPGIPIEDGLTLSFHSMSLPSARLVWHCPYISVFSSTDGTVNGGDFREYMLLRLDGENWESDDHVENNVTVDTLESFVGWNVWKDRNKEGIECAVTIKREKNSIIMQTENMGIAIRSVTTIHDDIGEVYVALTGDQCAITDIHISRE